jgi:hypothetical protein
MSLGWIRGCGLLLVLVVGAGGCVEDSDCFLTRTCPGPDAGLDGTDARAETDNPASDAGETEEPGPEPPDAADDETADDDKDTADDAPQLNLPLVPLPSATVSTPNDDAGAPEEFDAAVKDSGPKSTAPEPPSDACAESNGGCDPLTICGNGPAGLECGECPAGYVASGATRGALRAC